MEAKTAEVAAVFDATADMLKTAEKWIADMVVLMKHIANYQQTKPVYDGLKTAKDKTAYRREHESQLLCTNPPPERYGNTRVTAASSRTSPPCKRITRLTKKKNALRYEYGKLNNRRGNT